MVKTLNQKRFEEQERTLFKLIIFMGRVPPGVKNIFKWHKLIPYLYIWTLFILLCALSYLVPTMYFLLTHKVATSLMSQLLRRCVLYLYGILSLIAQSAKIKQLNALYAYWNEAISDEFYKTERQEVLFDHMKRTKTYFKFAAFGTVLVPHIFNIVTWLKRDSAYAELVGYPHDTKSPYHYCYAVLGTLHYLPSAIRLACDMLRLYLLTMLASQIQMLRLSLADIFDVGYIDPAVPGSKAEYERYVNNLRVSLRTWLRAHQKTIRWCREIKEYMGLECSLAFMGIANYMILYVFFVPTMLNGEISLILLTTIYGSFTMVMVFYEARLADEIESNSEQIFDDAFVKEWYLLPTDIQKSLRLIAFQTKERPIFFKAFGIYKDNSETFLKIVMVSYRCLMFLIQVYE